MYSTATAGWAVEELVIWGRAETNYGIVETGQNTEKSSGDLRRLAIIQSLMKDHKLKQV